MAVTTTIDSVLGVVSVNDPAGAGTVSIAGLQHPVTALTTAATIWACGLIGACIGSGHYFISVTGLIGMMLALYVDFDHFVRKKIHDITDSIDTLIELHKNEQIGRHFDIVPMFTHVVNFKSLFDVKFIENLYKDINKKDLSSETIAKIKYNISLQQWITTQEHTLTLYNS